MIEDASAGIDIPAANLFQAAAKREGRTLGIEYVASSQLLN
jgi:nicotinamidase/pyrazinamidase